MKNASDIIECIMIQVALGSIWRVVISTNSCVQKLREAECLHPILKYAS